MGKVNYNICRRNCKKQMIYGLAANNVQASGLQMICTLYIHANSSAQLFRNALFYSWFVALFLRNPLEEIYDLYAAQRMKILNLVINVTLYLFSLFPY